MKNKFKFWIVFSLVIVFAAGVIGGIFSERHLLPRIQRQIRREPPHFPYLEGMARELGLSQIQQEQIREIFKTNEGKLRSFRDNMSENLLSIRSQLKSEIENILTPDQKQKFEALIERYIGQRRHDIERMKEKNSQTKEHGNEKGETK